MGLVVQKYGGTSVGTPERIQAVAQRIALAHSQGQKLVVVVSAMGQTTDELIQLAHLVSQDPPHREMDMLLTAGERISMALLSMALADRNVPAISLTGSQSGIITTQSHRRARIVRILGDRVRAGLDAGRVVIVAGFQGVSENKEITTLGRGGSDTTAVALAAALGASVCQIYTDVDGVYSADPRIVKSARLLKQVGYDAMAVMATLGAGVLHPRSVEMARQYRVRLEVRNSHSDRGGTQIVESKSLLGMEEYSISGITCDLTKLLVTVKLARPSVLLSLWDMAAKLQLSFAAPLFADSMVHFYIDADIESEWRKLLQKMSVDGFIESFGVNSERVPVSLIGERLTQDGQAMSQVFDVLAKSGVTAELGQLSAISLTVAVPRSHAEDAVRELHLRFFGS